MSFIPETYEVPQSGSSSGRYFKPVKGDNKVRILTDCVMGWVYFNTETKPVRLPMDSKPKGTPADARIDDKGQPDKVKHFWAMVVFDYADNALKVWEITQGTIQGAIAAYARDPDWGHPRQYDLKITREGEGYETRYSLIASPQRAPGREILAAWNSTPINLPALFDGGDPFDTQAHSHSMAMSTADAVTAMVADAKARGVDVKKVCEAAELPIKASEYDEVQMLKLEDALKPHLATAEIADEEIPF